MFIVNFILKTGENLLHYVTVPDTKAGTPNSFAITGALLHIVRKYESLRPTCAKSDKFFLNYQSGKCTIQTIGKNKFYKMPRRIAEYLNLPEPDRYTGHSFRRTSATIYANSGATIEAMKRHTGHKSTKVCESYISASVGYKKKTGNVITASINCAGPSSSGSSVPTSSSTASVGIESSVPVDTLEQFVVPLINVNTGISSDNLYKQAPPVVCTFIQNDTCETNKSEGATVSTSIENDYTECFESAVDVIQTSQTVVSSQVSTQNVMAKLDKRFSFYK